MGASLVINRATGVVKSIKGSAKGVSELVVEVAGKDWPAINFDDMTGESSPGDLVLLNTTAVDLELGTGGCHFIMANLSAPAKTSGNSSPGHIMKLRYTPDQAKVLAVEEPDSPYHEIMAGAVSLDGTPVVCCSLHSMLPAAVCGAAAVDQGMKVVYVMTDGGALPFGFSRIAALLEKEGLINGSVTTGHAFGGDLEAVNLHSGLLAAKAVLKAEVIIVSMGPGIVGTNTPFGFSGIEQAGIVHAVSAVNGFPVVVPRISFADARERHRGLSHHSRTVLGQATLVQAYVGLPMMEEEKHNTVISQMEDCGIPTKHKIIVEDGSPGLELMRERGIKVTTMGRSVDQEKEFFLAASCAGSIAAKVASGEKLVVWEG